MTMYSEHFVTSQDNLRLYFREYGDRFANRVPIVCIPGLTRNSKDFHNVAIWLAERGHRVICPDIRGRGMSDYDPNWRNYRAQIYIYDVIQILIACNVENAVIIGTSMGGIMSMGLSIMKPKLIAGVILNDIGPDIASNGLGRILNYIGVDHPKRTWHEAIDHLRHLFPYMTLNGENEWLEFAQNTFREKSDGLFHYDWDVKIAKAIKAETGAIPDLWPLFKSLKRVPVLVIRGEQSDILTEETLEKMRLAHPNVTCVTIPQCGHTPTLNEIQSRQAIASFLKMLEQQKASHGFKAAPPSMWSYFRNFIKRPFAAM